MAQELGEKELLRMEVEQLRKEVKNPRTPISKTGKEIKDYVEAQAGNNPLLKGIPEDKNPFKEKGTFPLLTKNQCSGKSREPTTGNE
ncbi:Guanine Nucleotide-Binding Protein G(I)/G(S)/G(O) Subunit Gamma-T2 [Manis pentadactyla]|nr:Guanine Nucleotide-Binding Protein G(I)/G(S)/G(O) Subunit Gamma-T2 [Manis pentadactyla]